MSRKKKSLPFAAAVLVLAAVGVCSMLFGSVSLTPAEIAAAFNGTEGVAAVILFDLRLPRLLAACLAGAGLSAAGMLLQTVTDNDLCSPSIIGVNAGAGFFVMLTLCLFPLMWRLLPAAAFVGALGAALTVLAVARIGRAHEQKTTLVLAGVAMSSLLNAGIAFLSLKYPDALSSYTAFSVGSFSGVRLKQLTVPAAVMAGCFLLAVLAAPKIRLLCLGDEAAATLGVNVRLLRMLTVIIASGLCAAVVSFAGLLGFAGLIVPHIVRRVSNSGLRGQLCLSALCGAAVVAVSDLLGRTLFSPWELPAGIIMAFVGAPFFIYLIVRRRKSA